MRTRHIYIDSHSGDAFHQALIVDLALSIPAKQSRSSMSIAAMLTAFDCLTKSARSTAHAYWPLIVSQGSMSPSSKRSRTLALEPSATRSGHRPEKRVPSSGLAGIRILRSLVLLQLEQTVHPSPKAPYVLRFGVCWQ